MSNTSMNFCAGLLLAALAARDFRVQELQGCGQTAAAAASGVPLASAEHSASARTRWRRLQQHSAATACH